MKAWAKGDKARVSRAASREMQEAFGNDVGEVVALDSLALVVRFPDRLRLIGYKNEFRRVQS